MDDIVKELAGLVVLPDRMTGSLNQYAARLRFYIEKEQEKLLPDNGLVSVLCDAARLICENYELATSDNYGESQSLQAELTDLRAAMREIYEVWAGSEGIAETTASEAYQASLIYEMRDIAAKHLGKGK